MAPARKKTIFIALAPEEGRLLSQLPASAVFRARNSSGSASLSRSSRTGGTPSRGVRASSAR